MAVVLTAVGSLLASLLLTPVAASVGRRLGAVDRPGRLKVQLDPVPYLGGAAVFVPLATVVAVVRPALLIPLALALTLGLVDDRWAIGPIPRLVAGLAIGALVASAVPLREPQAVWAVAIIVLTVVMLNAVNLLDGLDALAGGVGLVSAAGFAVLLEGDGRLLAIAAVGALAGFLVFNRPPARIYLGDGGAYLLGATLAVLVAFASGPGSASARSVGAMVLVGVPLADLAVTVIRRTRAGRHIFTGDRGHVYDQLTDRGLRPARISLRFALAQAVLAAAGVLLARFPLGLALAAAGVVAVGLLVGAAACGFLSPSYRRSTSGEDDDHDHANDDTNAASPRLRVHPLH